MGYTLCGHAVDGLDFNVFEWGHLFELGGAFGWKPQGTLYPERPPEAGPVTYPDVDKAKRSDLSGYFGNDFQWVTDEDAAAWGAALFRAVAALERETPLTPWQARVVGGNWAPGQTESLRYIAAAFSHGGFAIG
jgi:hypothetical protein